MSERTRLLLFFLGWVTYSFALVNVGPYSVTLMLIASLLLFRINFRSPILVASLVVSGVLAVAVSLANYQDHGKTISHLVQYVICLGVFMGCLEIDMNRQFAWLRRLILVLGAVALVYGGYQFIARVADLPYAFLPITNLQLGADEGFQRGYSTFYLGAHAFTRVSSLFAEPSDMGRFMLWVYAFGSACRERRLKIALSCVGIAGILVSQSLGAVVGVAVLVATATLLRRNLRECVVQAVLLGTVACSILYFSPNIGRALGDRVAMILQDRQGYLDRAGRFRDRHKNMEVFYENPWLGHGIGSVKKVAPENVISHVYTVVLIERGLVGTLTYYFPFLWVFLRLSLSKRRHDEVTQTALCLLIVELYCMTTFAAMYFPPIYFALALAVSRAPGALPAAAVLPGMGPAGLKRLPPSLSTPNWGGHGFPHAEAIGRNSQRPDAVRNRKTVPLNFTG